MTKVARGRSSLLIRLHSNGCSLRPGDAFTSQFDAAKLKKDLVANWMKLIKLVDDFHYALPLCAVRVQNVQTVHFECVPEMQVNFLQAAQFNEMQASPIAVQWGISLSERV